VNGPPDTEEQRARRAAFTAAHPDIHLAANGDMALAYLHWPYAGVVVRYTWRELLDDLCDLFPGRARGAPGN